MNYVPRKKIPPGTSIPIRSVTSPKVPDVEKEPGKHIALGLAALYRQTSRIATMIADKSRPVDEYSNQTLAAESNTVLVVQPQWETPELIESILVTGPSNAQGSVENENSVTGPAANQVIASIFVPPGPQIINWTVGLGGSTAGIEANNFQLEMNGQVLLMSMNNSNSGNVTVQPAVEVIAPPGGATISINAVVAGTGTAIYRAQLESQGTPGVFQLQLGDRTWNLELNNSGLLVIAPIKLWLGRDDPRILTSNTPGEWTLELMGHADTRGNLV